MKILLGNYFRQAVSKARRRNEDGLATIVFIALLAIMVMLVTANTMALIRLHKEARYLEQQQIKRLNGLQTNSLPANLNTKNEHQK